MAEKGHFKCFCPFVYFELHMLGASSAKCVKQCLEVQKCSRLLQPYTDFAYVFNAP